MAGSVEDFEVLDPVVVLVAVDVMDVVLLVALVEESSFPGDEPVLSDDAHSVGNGVPMTGDVLVPAKLALVVRVSVSQPSGVVLLAPLPGEHSSVAVG